jgi:hypothetical protein
MNPYLENLYSKSYSITGVKRGDRFIVEPDPKNVLGIFLGFLFFYNQTSEDFFEAFMPDGDGWVAQMGVAAACRLTEPEDFPDFLELPFELDKHEIWQVEISSIWGIPAPSNSERLTGEKLRDLIRQAARWQTEKQP